MLTSPSNQFRMCSVCRNQRPSTSMLLLPCCFRQSICLWCVAASVEIRNSVECLLCGGNFLGPFVSNEISSRMKMSSGSSPNGSVPASPQQLQARGVLRHQGMSSASTASSSFSRSNVHNGNGSYHTTCYVSGCGRRSINEACYHCGAWLCSIDDFVHKEDLADKQIGVLRMIIKRAREWQTSFGDSTATNNSNSSEGPGNKYFDGSCDGLRSPTVFVTTPDQPDSCASKINGSSSLLKDANAAVDVANGSSDRSFDFVETKSDEMQMVIERADELTAVLESKRARRLDLRAIAAEISDMKKKVSFVEGVQVTRPNNIQVPKNHTQQLNALISASSAEIPTVEKLRIAIALEEERLKERRKTLTPCSTQPPLPLLLVVSEIAATDIEKKKLYFHRVHGSNIVLSSDLTQASRKDVAKTNGGNIVFTSRPVAVNERVCVTCLQSYPTSHSIEIGFTIHDPQSLAQDLPDSFANAQWGRDEQSWVHGFWIHIGRGILSRENETLTFCFNAGGQVIIVEGNGATSTQKLPPAFANQQPAWGLIDLAGRPSIVSVRSSNTLK